MNTCKLGRASARMARWPATPVRGVKRKAPPPQRQSHNPAATTPRRTNPHLQKFQDTEMPDPEPPKPKHGLSPRVLTIFGVSTLGISIYCGYLYASYQQAVAKAQSLDVPTDVSDRYNQTALTFDGEVEMAEKVMRMGPKRRDLVRMARGDVLEVSCGTGRNLAYYELGERRGVDGHGRAQIRGCRSVTFVDLSPQMVAITRRKFETLYPDFQGATFSAQDAGSVPAPSPQNQDSGTASASKTRRPYYDTIVQTMGLCSMPDPVGTLRHLGSITEPAHGRILLLEHGRSHYDWLNRILDNLAPTHADRHGCWWNRDIGAIVRDSGLEVLEEKRWHFGTTWRYVLRPPQASTQSRP